MKRPWAFYDLVKHRKVQFRKYGVIRPVQTYCRICFRFIAGSNIVLDHDHKTGRFRGWLCKQCNSKLGWFERFQSRIEVHLR